MDATQSKLTVVLPIYNEAKSVDDKFHELLEFARQNPQYHFRFVDDGSTDGTPERIQADIERDQPKNVSLLALKKNGGKGAAIRAGFDEGCGPLFVFLDGDLAYSLEHLFVMEKALEKDDVVIGCRNLISHVTRSTKRRQFLGWAFNRLARLILDFPYTDTQAGLKGFRKAAAEKVFHHQTLSGFSFDVEALYLARKYGFTVGEIPAKVCDRHTYKISRVKLIRDSTHMFGEMLSIRWKDFCGRYDA
jgi:glycosyltransferase involved in cell wall biosynthesis